MERGGDSQQQRAKVLASREKQITERIDKDFFAEESSFRPLVHVIDVLGSSDGSVNTVSLERLRGQCELANAAMEEFVDVNYGYLNGNVEAMGKILRKFNDTFTNVTRLRKQVSECKSALLEGLREQNIRQMWVRKKEHEYILHMLDRLEMLKDTPTVFDELVKEKRYLAAVTRLNAAIDAMFSKELVDVAAIVKVRDEILERKGRFMELVMEDLISALHLRLLGNSGLSQRGGKLAQGMRAGSPSMEDDGNHDASGDNMGGTGRSRTGSFMAGNQEGSTRSFRIPASVDLTEQGEASLDDPTQDAGMFLCYMVEAARRLNCLDDLETYASERIRREVRAVAWGHFTRIKAQSLKQRLAMASDANNHSHGTHRSGGTGEGEARQDDVVAPLLDFLKVLYADFTAIVENHMSFISLLDTARGKGPTGAGVPPLVAALWKEMQDYLQEFLHSHIRAEDTEFYLSPDALQADVEEVAPSSVKMWGIPGMQVPLPNLANLPNMPNLANLPNIPGMPMGFPGSRAAEGPPMVFNRNFFAISQLSEVMPSGSEEGEEEGRGVDNNGGVTLLCTPEVSNVVSIYRPTLKFVTKILAIIGSTGESALTRGVVRYLSDFVGETLIPYLSTQTVNTKLRKILEDKDALSPIATDRKAASKLPNKAAQQVLELCKELHVYSAQLPQHKERISHILNAALESYISRISTELSSCMAQTACATVCSGPLKERLREALHSDPTYDVYKHYWAKHHNSHDHHHRHHHRHEPSPPPSPVTEERSPSARSTSSLESSLALQPELWRFDVQPYPLTRSSITLDKKKLLMVASLAYSADWLAYEVRKLGGGKHGATRHQSDATSRTSHRGWVDNIANELFQVSETCLLFLRLEAEYSCYYFMQQLPLTRFDGSSPTPPTSSPSPTRPTAVIGSSGPSTLAALAAGGKAAQAQGAVTQAVVEMCISSLNRYLLSLEDAICGVASTEYYALAIAHLPRLLPRLLIHAVTYINKVSCEGIERLNRVFVALQQTVPILLDGVGSSIGREAGLLHELVSKEFARARLFLSLLELDEDKLAVYIRQHKDEYTKENYRAVWMQSGPHKTVTSDSAGRFNAVWLA